MAYVWAGTRNDVYTASAEVTENITVLEGLATVDISNLLEGSLEALREFKKVKLGAMLPAIRATGRGYELLYVWLEALLAFAEHTNQLA